MRALARALFGCSGLQFELKTRDLGLRFVGSSYVTHSRHKEAVGLGFWIFGCWWTYCVQVVVKHYFWDC
ncbi:hypothetical protein ACET3Z_028613 [Daucus carota]